MHHHEEAQGRVCSCGTSTETPAVGLRVLCAIDGSEGSVRAFLFALERVVVPERNDILVLFEAARPLNPEILADMTKRQSDFVQELEELNCGAELRVMSDQADARGVHTESVVLLGDPRELIPEYVAKHPVDLLVVGSRGLSTTRRLFLGSVSSYLVDHSPVPVMVVRAQADGE
ncbi:universal stress protein family protein [Klebsormidium nitens]|uniref:Universal stress protein family protein n=1 Tax=Klebsormidium nitens TaxID=105231 RepID=A0A1Y1I5H6_KLENI|nr:universal stress protein family protein [Klebsormidium nitens]|eukprot:GAQ83966.1 universal stress protein family protein [Klebsormidium nitens]